MRRLYTKQQVFRAIRKRLRDYPAVREYDAVRNLLFDLMEDKFLNDVYLDFVADLYNEDYINQEVFDEASDAMYMYYGDLIEQYLKENEDELY